MMKDLIGINGHTVKFNPALYSPLAHRVRDYHPVEWDLQHAPDQLPPFPLAKNKVDWNKVYGSWRQKSWNTDVCLMFESVPRADWKNPEATAYGEAFAREFGPSGQRKLVDSVEIGNEPGKWSDPDYTAMTRAMAQGIRKGDPKLQIATCNLSVGKSGPYEKSVKCVEGDLGLVDVLTIHTYAQLEGWPTWRRSYPEDPKLPHYLNEIEALCHWRDLHAPSKPLWVTEFGYDSTTKAPDPKGPFAKWVGVSDEQQAQYLVRSLLLFSSMPVDRAYIFFFNDEDQPSLHASSGLTRHFQPKPSYYAISQLQSLLGEYRFGGIIQNEPGRIRVQEYWNGPKGRIWAVWSPTGEGKSFEQVLQGVPGKLLGTQNMRLGAEMGKGSGGGEPRQRPDGSVELTVRESPVYLLFEKP